MAEKNQYIALKGQSVEPCKAGGEGGGPLEGGVGSTVEKLAEVLNPKQQKELKTIMQFKHSSDADCGPSTTEPSSASAAHGGSGIATTRYQPPTATGSTHFANSKAADIRAAVYQQPIPIGLNPATALLDDDEDANNVVK